MKFTVNKSLFRINQTAVVLCNFLRYKEITKKWTIPVINNLLDFVVKKTDIDTLSQQLLNIPLLLQENNSQVQLKKFGQDVCFWDSRELLINESNLFINETQRDVFVNTLKKYMVKILNVILEEK